MVADPPLDVLLVEDHPVERDAIAALLADCGLTVRTAADATHALATLSVAVPDALLLDVMMPERDGIAVCREVRSRHPDLPIVFMTGLGRTEDVVRGFAAGGTDYVTKPISAEVVCARIGAHVRTARTLARTRRLAEVARQSLPGAAGTGLTPREAEVLGWIGLGKSNRDIAEILGMSPRTVNKHLEHIYEKLGVENRTAAVSASIRRRGAGAGPDGD